MAIDRIDSSLTPNATDVVTTIRAKQFTETDVTLSGTRHTISSVSQLAPKVLASKVASDPIKFIPVPLNPALKTITTQGQLAHFQSERVAIALTLLNTYSPKEDNTRKILENLKASIDRTKLVHPDQAPAKAALGTAKTLSAALMDLLIKAGVPEDQAREAFSEELTFTPIALNSPAKVITTQAQQAFVSIPQLAFPSTTSTKMLAQLQAKQIEAALIVLKDHDEADRIQFSSGSRVKWQRFNTAIQTLEHLQKSVLQSVVHKGETEATPLQLQLAKKTEKDLMALLANQIGKPEATLRAQWRAELTLLQNQQPWERVQTRFEDQGVTYYSEHTPAGRLTLDEQVLLPSYHGQGISSATTKESTHAVNLWASTFSADSQVLFKGVRHAILSPFGLKKGSKEREEGAVNRAKEVVIAALALDPAKLTQALEGDIVELRLASTSLVTATDLPINKEGPQIADQILAWDKLSKEKPLILTIPHEGEIKEIKVNVNVAAFNFGVNEIALKLGRFGLGWKQSDAYNVQAFPLLIGSLNKAAPIGGWAGEFLANASEKDKEFVQALVAQIRDIWANKSHHYDANEPYKMATRVAILAHLIGATPAWNCKSGKDRTGILDSEIKNMLIQHQTAPLPRAPGAPFSDEDKVLYKKVLANTGNLEIQQYNTGVQGNKVLTNHFLSLSLLKERIDDKKHIHAMHGLSFLVKS